MLLKEHLTEFTKEELLNQARSLEIRGYSRLRKADLVDKIVEDFCTEEMMWNRLSCLTKEQLELFRKACVTPQDISADEVMDGMQLYRYLVGYFEESTDRFCVFEDVADAFRKVDDDDFQAEQYKKGWMVKCIDFFMNYYGIAPVEIIHQMYKQRVKCTLEEMIEVINEMPVGMTESYIFSMDNLGMEDWPKEDPVYSENGLLVHIPILEEGEFDYWLAQQRDKDFYIPSAQQIDEICQFGYEASSQAYKKLEAFLTKKLSLSGDLAFSWCLQVWSVSYEGGTPTEVINKMTEADIVFDGEQSMNEFVGILMTAHNHTRMMENRGHKPSEISKRTFAGKMPVIVPGSSHAAAILKDVAPQLQSMGIPFDVDGNADVIPATVFPSGLNGESVRLEKKVYPNDPCPCGSGKKYKKCCGKNK